MKTYFKFLLALGFAVLANPVLAADNYKLDPAHTWVNFSVNHGGWSSAAGQFRTVSGDIVFDRDDVTKSSVKIEITASSIDTNLEKRNTHLKSPDFFNSAEFPKITFESTLITKTGKNTATITGNLNMLGVSKSIMLNAVFNKADDSKAGFSATGKLTPADFGMSKVAGFGMGPDVQFSVEVEALKQ